MRRTLFLAFAVLSALGAYAGPLAAADEVCNGVDDNANGKIDAADPALILTLCEKQSGVCAGVYHSRAFCSAGVWKVCSNSWYATQRPTAPNNYLTSDTSCNGVDNDCDGSTDENYVVTTTTCGIGRCAATGLSTCVGGVVGSTCVPGTPWADDSVANQIDDDCDGLTDEDYVCTPLGPIDDTCDFVDDDCDSTFNEDFVPYASGTTCGTGACQAGGTVTCVDRVPTVVCTPGAPSQEVCNGVDDDCDTKTDAADNTLQKPLCEKQIGLCAGVVKSASLCVAGSWAVCSDSVYRAARPTYLNPDNVCDGVDSNCDGATDEAWASVATACGIGGCASTGASTCTAGVYDDGCTEGAPVSPDIGNGIDDDCDGLTDEDCTPGSTPETECNGIDDDCDALVDEDYVPTPAPSSCGVGACLRNGEYQCLVGVVTDVCTPGTPSQEVCDTIDNDCDGKLDGADNTLLRPACEKTDGVCAGALHTGTLCVGGAWNACTTSVYRAHNAAYATTEPYVCDTLDNDCNGQTDEDCCRTAFTDLPVTGFLGNALCPVPGTDCASITRDVSVSTIGNCPGLDTFELWVDGALAATVSSAGGTTTFTGRTFTDGTAPSLEVRGLAATTQITVTPTEVVTVDLTDPVVAFTTVDVGGFLTPATGSTQTYTLADDQNSGVTGLQIPLHMQITDANLDGGFLDPITGDPGTGPVDLAVGSPALPLLLGPGPIEQTVTDVTVPDGALTITATALDAAGNEATTSFATSGVDATPPDAVTVTLGALDRHLPSVVLNWTAPGDDGAIGLAVAYDIRFSKSPITDEASFNAACPVDDVTSMSPPAVPQAAGTAETLVVSAPDVRSATGCKFVTGDVGDTYYFAIRAVDDVGNWSPISAAEVASTTELSVKTAQLTFAGSISEARMDRLFTPLGDVNGDGLADFSSYSSVLGKACVFLGQSAGAPGYGISDLTFTDDSSATHQCFSGTGVGYMVAGLGDIDGDGIGDWALGYGGPTEHIDVFAGQVSGTPPIGTTPYLRLTGQSYSTTNLGSQVYRIGDFDGDGLADIGVGSRRTNIFYIILGNAALTPGDPLTTIDVTNAATYGTFRVVRVAVTGAAADSYFGMNAVGAGNMLPDVGDDGTPPGEVAIYMQNSPNQVFLLKGRAVTTSPVDLTLSASATGTATNNGEVVRFFKEATATEGLFGIDLSGGFDLNGGGVPDLVIGHYLQGLNQPSLPYTVYVLYGETLAPRLGKNVVGVSLTNPPPAAVGEGTYAGTYGVVIAGNYRRPAILGDFDGATGTHADLVMHDLSSTTWGSVWVRLNNMATTPAIPRGTFPYVDLTITSPYAGQPASAFGNTVFPLGDFNGDGYPDILVGTRNGGYPTIVY